MGLKGNLATVNLADVFQVLSRGNSTGLLRIQAPEGPRFVEIQNGAISIAGRSSGRILLGDLLLSRGLADEATLNAALQAQRESGKLLGQILLDNNSVSREALEEALRFQIEEEVCELFTLGKGDFDFLAGATLDAKIAPAGGLVRLKIDPNSLLLEAARRADEWKSVERRIVSQSLLFKLSPQGAELLNTGTGLSAEGLVLLKLVQDTRSIESMVQKACLGRLNTNQMLLELWDAGLVEPMPFDTYFSAAQAHFRAGRIDEAQRLAEVTVNAGSSTDKAKAVTMLNEIEKSRKASISGTMAATTDPKVRSEVIRRAAPGLILKKERKVLPYALAGVALLVIGGGVGAYFVMGNQTKVDPKYRKMLDEEIAKADDLIKAHDYNKGLEQLRTFKLIFRSADSETQTLATQKYEDRIKDVEAALNNAINNFSEASKKGAPDELKAAAAELDHFDDVVALSADAQKNYADARVLLDQYKNKSRNDATRARLRELDGAARKSSFDELKAGFEKLLADNPPEESGVEVRDGLAKLLRARRDADARLRLAAEERDAGEYDSARSRLEAVKRDGPGGSYIEKASSLIDSMDKDAADYQKRLDHVDVLQTQKSSEEAKAELLKILNGHPPDRIFTAALDTLHTIEAQPEVDLEKELQQAQALKDSKPAEYNKQVLELLRKAPWSKTASKAVLMVTVKSDPPGAEIFHNGRAAGTTPAQLTAPAVGLAHITIKKRGFQTEEIAVSNLRKDHFDVTLQKLAAASRRLPFAAGGGLAVDADNVVLLGATEVSTVSPSDLKLQARLRLKPAEVTKPFTAAANGLALTLANGYALAALQENGIAALKLASGDCRRLGAQLVTSAPLLYTSAELGAKPVVAAATTAGVDCEFLEDGTAHKTINVQTPGSTPWGLAVSGDTLLIPREDRVCAVSGTSGAQLWQAQTDGKLAGGPAIHGKTFAVVTTTGRLFVFTCDAGDKRFQQDTGAACTLPVISLSQGYLTCASNGKLTLTSADKGTQLWSAPLPAGAVLPPVALRAKDADPESAIAVCYPRKDTSVLAAVSTADGSVLWSSELPGKPAAIASLGEKIYVSTVDGDLIVYDLN